MNKTELRISNASTSEEASKIKADIERYPDTANAKPRMLAYATYRYINLKAKETSANAPKPVTMLSKPITKSRKAVA